MYYIAICEDSLQQQSYLKEILNHVSVTYHLPFHIDCFSSGELFIKQNANHYDLIILDIQMGALDGIATAKYIRQSNKDVKIIFVTACEHYWPEGYYVNAYRFMLKPLDREKFIEEILCVFKEIQQSHQFIMLRTLDGLQKVLIEHITYLEIVDRRVIFHTLHGDYPSHLSLHHWNQELIPKGFANPHKSYLVHLKYVASLSKEEVVLSNDACIYVSQRKYKSFKEAFMQYVASF